MTIVDLAAAAATVAPWGSPGHDPVADVWARLRRPFDPVTAVAGVAGLSTGAAALAVATAVAGSPEADRLLDELPRTIRALATATTSHSERCRGGLRGPVLWSETMSARSSSFGATDLYVCLTPARAYDVAENRVLVAALTAVAAAGRIAVEHTPVDEQHARSFRRLRRNGDDARRFVEHPSLQGVSRGVPDGRALRRTRAGKKRAVYTPALAMLDRVANPLGPGEVGALCDERTRARLRLFTGILAGLEGMGVPVPPVRAVPGGLESAGVALRHPHATGGTAAAVTAGPWRLDVPGGPDERPADAVTVVADDDGLAAVVADLVSRRSRGRPPRS